MTVRDALNKAMDEEMERDARVFIIGSSYFTKTRTIESIPFF
jgi:pyruvate/2-oxoglutarate/acetoin dehydrogenase E1 component